VTRYWTVGYAPYYTIGAPVYTSRAEAAQRAREENRCGENRGRGCKAYPCDEGGNLIVKNSVFARAQAARAEVGATD